MHICDYLENIRADCLGEYLNKTYHIITENPLVRVGFCYFNTAGVLLGLFEQLDQLLVLAQDLTVLLHDGFGDLLPIKVSNRLPG